MWPTRDASARFAGTGDAGGTMGIPLEPKKRNRRNEAANQWAVMVEIESAYVVTADSVTHDPGLRYRERRAFFPVQAYGQYARKLKAR